MRELRRGGGKAVDTIGTKSKRCVALGVVLFTSVTAVCALDIQHDIIGKAQQYEGSSYCHGGVSPPCFDCSGFVLTVYGDHVSSLPRVSREMARVGEPVERDNLQPGDLVFFATGSRPHVVTHVAIYMGQDSIIHAISNGPDRGVTITPLNARYWERRYYTARRVLPRAEQVELVREEEALEFSRGVYSGDLRKGEPHGNGTMKMHNGDRYRGGFKEGLFDGEGEYVWANGDRYKGSFRQGEMHGEGVFVTADGEEILREESSRRTYITSNDSPWETWDGVVEGDFRAWQEEEQRAYEEFRRESEPPEQE